MSEINKKSKVIISSTNVLFVDFVFKATRSHLLNLLGLQRRVDAVNGLLFRLRRNISLSHLEFQTTVLFTQAFMLSLDILGHHYRRFRTLRLLRMPLGLDLWLLLGLQRAFSFLQSLLAYLICSFFCLQLFCEELVTQRLRGCYSLFGIFAEKSFQQVQLIGRELLVEIRLKVYFTLLILFESFIEGQTGEWRTTQKENMEDDSHTEQVTYVSIASFRVFQRSDFRSHISGSSTAHKKQLLTVNFRCQAEISNHAFPFGIVSEHNILWLEVTMHVTHRVQGLQSSQNACHDVSQLSRSHPEGTVYSLEKLSSCQVLNDQIQRVFALINSIKSHEVGVRQSPHGLYFVDKALLPLVLGVGMLFAKGLDGVELFILMALDLIDSCEGSLAQFSQRLELFVESSLIEPKAEVVSPEGQF